MDQEGWSGRLFVRAHQDPYALVPAITRTIHEMSADQPVEHASTLNDVRAEVLTPDRLNAIVFGGFAAVALLISVVGVAGVLAFSVSGRTREFGIRMALGAQPRNILTDVLVEGLAMAGIGCRNRSVDRLCSCARRQQIHYGDQSAGCALVCRFSRSDPGRGCRCVCRACGARRAYQRGRSASFGMIPCSRCAGLSLNESPVTVCRLK